MQDVNLQQLQAAAAKVSQSVSTTGNAAGSSAALANLTPVTASLNQHSLVVRSSAGKVLVALDLPKQPGALFNASTNANTQSSWAPSDQLLRALPELKYAAVNSAAQQLQLYGEARTLLNTQVSSQQFQNLLDVLAKLPDASKALSRSTLLNTPLNAVVSAVSGQRVIVSLQPPVAGVSSVPLTINNSNLGLEVGQPVKVQIQQRAGQWVAELIPANLRPAAEPSTEQKNLAKTPVVTTGTPIKATLSTSSPLVKQTLIQSLNTGLSVTTSNPIFAPLLAQLPSTINTMIQQISQGAAQQTNIQLSLKITGQQLIVSAQTPLLKLDTKQQQTNQHSWQQLSKLSAALASNQSAPTPQTNRADSGATGLRQFLQLPVVPQSQARSQPQSQSLRDSVSISSTASTMQQPQAPAPFVRQDMSIAKPSEQAQQVLQTALKHSFMQASSATENRQALLQAVEQLRTIQQPEIKPLIDKSLAQISGLTTPQPDATQIRQLIQLPAVPIQAQNLALPQTANNLVTGLITLLQLSLASRVPSKSGATQSPISQIISVLNTVVQNQTQEQHAKLNAKPKGLRKTSQDSPSLDPNASLTKALSRVLSAHYHNKLSQADSTNQGQELLYYAFPSSSQSSQRDTELTITREKPSDSNAKRTSNDANAWRLTMLLSIGVLGDALCKCRLEDMSLELDIYTSTEDLKVAVLEHLPLLKKRFCALGLELNNSQCQLGKIPETLKSRPYQLLQTTV